MKRGAEVEKYLKQEHKEAVVLEADGGRDDVFQVFATNDLKCGTLVFKRKSQGVSCIMDAVENIRPPAPPPPATPQKQRGREYSI